MSVLRKYNPDTQQWDILQGGVQGLQGPPVSLTKGTVTTGAPGTNADFTVTGTPPNQKLNLTIPRGEKGDTGNPSTYLIVGPGRPDTPATTGGTVTGSEPVGAEYRSTDGANVGAWVWMKRPSGWVVTDGDTGWRKISTGVADLNLRRIGDWVEFNGRVDGTYTNPIVTLPLAFRPRYTSNGLNFTASRGGVANTFVQYNFNTNGNLGITGSAPNLCQTFTWSTTETWPTTLPGTPA